MDSKKTIRNVGSFWISLLGSRIEDYRTGEPLGRAFIFVWRGQIHLLGYTGEKSVRAIFIPQEKVSYWKQSIGFVAVESPDFANEVDDVTV